MNKPDFILINEVGVIKEKFIDDLNENYNIIAPIKKLELFLIENSNLEKF